MSDTVFRLIDLISSEYLEHHEIIQEQLTLYVLQRICRTPIYD